MTTYTQYSVTTDFGGTPPDAAQLDTEIVAANPVPTAVFDGVITGFDSSFNEDSDAVLIVTVNTVPGGEKTALDAVIAAHPNPAVDPPDPPAPTTAGDPVHVVNDGAGGVRLPAIDGSQLTGVGDVSGPASSTNTGVARFDGTSGKTLKSSDPTIDDNGAVGNVERIAYKTEVNNGNSGATETIDWTAGQKQRSTLTADCTFSFTAPAGPTNLLLKLVQDGSGQHDATWPGSVLWAKGKAPNLTNGGGAIDIVTFYYDGTNYFGVASLDFS